MASKKSKQRFLRRQLILAILLALCAVAMSLVTLFIYSCQDDWCFLTDAQRAGATHSFEACFRRGYPVIDDYPRKCVLPDGTVLTEILQ